MPDHDRAIAASDVIPACSKKCQGRSMYFRRPVGTRCERHNGLWENLTRKQSEDSRRELGSHQVMRRRSRPTSLQKCHPSATTKHGQHLRDPEEMAYLKEQRGELSTNSNWNKRRAEYVKKRFVCGRRKQQALLAFHQILSPWQISRPSTDTPWKTLPLLESSRQSTDTAG